MRKKKKNNSTMVVGIFIGVIMILSTLGFIFGDANTANEAKIGKHRFIQEGNTWKIKNSDFIVYNHPSTLTTSDIDEQIVNSINNADVITVTFDPNMEDIQYVDLFRFDLAAVKYVLGGVLEETLNYNLPIVDCTNGDGLVIEIINGEGEFSQISDTCIKIAASGRDILILRDLIYLKIAGVI